MTRPQNEAPISQPSGLRIAASAVVGTILFAALLFLAAGRLDWPAGWIYLVVVVSTLAANYIYLDRKNPELIAHRMRIGKGTKTWDMVWMWLFTPAFCSVYLVAGLDAGRFGWSDMPVWLWGLGLTLYVPGMLFNAWAMGVNPFFEKTVRIQHERGHRVIDSGPYAFVRHPGYVGFTAWLLSAPLMLGSWWAYVPALLAVGSLFVRTALEDRTLREELPGYGDYARRVRSRLLPGVW